MHVLFVVDFVLRMFVTFCILVDGLQQIWACLLFADPSNFDKFVNGGKAALVEFYAPWWGHSLALKIVCVAILVWRKLRQQCSFFVLTALCASPDRTSKTQGPFLLRVPAHNRLRNHLMYVLKQDCKQNCVKQTSHSSRILNHTWKESHWLWYTVDGSKAMTSSKDHLSCRLSLMPNYLGWGSLVSERAHILCSGVVTASIWLQSTRRWERLSRRMASWAVVLWLRK